jgi:hypothetical protein
VALVGSGCKGQVSQELPEAASQPEPVKDMAAPREFKRVFPSASLSVKLESAALVK